MQPNISYGWGGTICYCPKAPLMQYQRPASKKQSHPFYQTDGAQLKHNDRALEASARDAVVYGTGMVKLTILNGKMIYDHIDIRKVTMEFNKENEITKLEVQP